LAIVAVEPDGTASEYFFRFELTGFRLPLNMGSSDAYVPSTGQELFGG
jgi:hypothetical protein